MVYFTLSLYFYALRAKLPFPVCLFSDHISVVFLSLPHFMFSIHICSYLRSFPYSDVLFVVCLAFTSIYHTSVYFGAFLHVQEVLIRDTIRRHDTIRRREVIYIVTGYSKAGICQNTFRGGRYFSHLISCSH